MYGASGARLATALGVTACLTSAACGATDPGQPDAFSGGYDLQLIDSEGLPLIRVNPFTGDSLFVLSGTVEVRTHGRASLTRQSEWHLASGGRAPVTDTATIVYRRSADTVFLDHPSGGPAGAYTDTGTVSADHLFVNTLLNLYVDGLTHQLYTYIRR